MAKDKTDGPATVFTTRIPRANVSFDIPALDHLIRTSGVTFIHYRAMVCPVGMTDANSNRRPHDDHEGCSNGYLYTAAGKVTCTFIGNQTSQSFSELGAMDGSSVHATFPRYYDGTERPVNILPKDRLFLDEENITVGHWQLVEHNASGKDRLSFPVVEVIDLIDSQGKRYQPGDFEVVGGQIHWSGNDRPGLDPQLGKGRVYSVRYNYRPYWYIKTLVHEVRVAQVENPYSGMREVNRIPQEAVLQREYIYEKEEKDDQATDPLSVRQVKSPASGLFGPR